MLLQRRNNGHSLFWPIGTTQNRSQAIQVKEQVVGKKMYNQVHHVKQSYGGELVVLPGDSANGKWDTEEFAKKFKPHIKVKNRVLQAGRNCYGTMRALFTDAGYEQILIAVGDHELGGNAWTPGTAKVKSVGKYRQGFMEGFNTEPETGRFLFRKAIGSAPSRPLNTPFQETSYAHQHRNVLFITLDAFLKMPEIFMDRKHGLGGEGVITCSVEGEHLNWFENVLIEARKDETIKHIIVQAHLPIIQPVRKVSCSGQFMDHGEESALWKVMVKYDVDVYLAGEVHTNTATKDSGSNLLQIVSRGNSFNNFLKIDVTDNALNITSYNEIGPKPKNNYNYEAYGNLVLDKAALCHTLNDRIFAEPATSTKDNNTDSVQMSLRLDTLATGSIVTKKSGLALITCGSGSSYTCGSTPHKWVNKNEKHPVRCCSYSYINSPSTQQHSESCPFATSCFNPSTFDGLPFFGFEKNKCNDGLCSGKMRYNQARKLCAAVGGYICKKRDLADDCAISTGCQYDGTFVWSQANDRTESPSTNPTSHKPTTLPSYSPSNKLTPFPTNLPTTMPNVSPSTIPSSPPSRLPTAIPSASPFDIPSSSPSRSPTGIPSPSPSDIPTSSPSASPSDNPSSSPSRSPTGMPSPSPSDIPTSSPSVYPSDNPSSSPSRSPTAMPSPSPSDIPSSYPSHLPTTIPSIEPTLAPRCTHISSSGVLQLLHKKSALIHIDFEKKIPLRKRQVVGMHHDDEKDKLIGSRITIRGIKSKYSLPNKGSFDQPYDAQVANVKLNSFRGRSFGVFTNRSRLAIYGMGPHSGGSVISYALWIRTHKTSEMILVNYGHSFTGKSTKSSYTLTLQDGTPMLYISPTAILRPKMKYDLNDGDWHHIAVSMPRKSCALSEVIMYVDGKTIETSADGFGYDNEIFFTTSGRLSIGGFGYSHESYEENYPHLSPYIGRMDEVYVWARSLKGKDMKLLMEI